MDNKRRMTLNTAGYTPAVFNGITYTPITADYSILERAFALNEERKKEAVVEHNAIKSALGKARNELHKDAETMSWFDNKSKNIENQLQQIIDSGDYFSVINAAKNFAGDLANDAELWARIQNNKEYNAEMQRINDMVKAGKLTEVEANYYRKSNPYTNKFITENNKIIGAEQWKLKEEPVESLDINKHFQEVASLYKADRTSYTNSSNFQKTNALGITTQSMDRNSNISSTTETIGHAEQKVDPADLLNFATERLYAEGDWERKLRQHFNGAWQQFKDLQDEVKQYENSGDIENSDYIAKKANLKKYKQLFQTDDIDNIKNKDAYMKYYATQLFKSKQAKAYGFKITDDTHTLNGMIRTDGDGNQQTLQYNFQTHRWEWTNNGPVTDVKPDVNNNVVKLKGSK